MLLPVRSFSASAKKGVKQFSAALPESTNNIAVFFTTSL
jgi:hypothetical protein